MELTSSLHIFFIIYELFKGHKCHWMEWISKNFTEEIVLDFYASYATTIRNSMTEQAKSLANPSLHNTLVLNFFIYIFDTTIHHFSYGPTHNLRSIHHSMTLALGCLEWRISEGHRATRGSIYDGWPVTLQRIESAPSALQRIESAPSGCIILLCLSLKQP